MTFRYHGSVGARTDVGRGAVLVVVVALAVGCDVDNSPKSNGCESDGVRIAVCPGRGLYDGPVEVEMAATRPGAKIYYTLDGSVPTLESGTVYAGPVTLAGTPERGVAILRATSLDGPSSRTPVVTHSFIFLNHVVAQPSAPAGFPAVWGVADLTRDADYEMDPDVVGDGLAARNGLASLPTLSLVMDAADLFGARTGIYMDPQQDPSTRERPAFVELMPPDGVGFGVAGGVRVQGATSTYQWQAAKLSLRVLFKREYGPAKLRFPVFPDSDVTEFDTLVLDAHHSDTWIHRQEPQRRRAQYLRDTFISDLQIAVGGLAPQSRFVHLYLNGLYWGIYDLHERPDDSFAAEYLGGDKRDYDALRHEGRTGSTLVAGDRVAWDAMFDLARGDLADPASYRAFQQYLDVEDFIDYMIVNFYAGNEDWPNNNWYAARRRADGSGFRFFSWDAEYVLRGGRNRTDVNGDGGPGELYQALLANDDLRATLAARAATLLGDGGVLGPQHTAALYRRRLDEIDAAIILESARWGDNRRAEAPYTRSDWAAERDWLLSSYFPERSRLVLSQLQAITEP